MDINLECIGLYSTVYEDSTTFFERVKEKNQPNFHTVTMYYLYTFSLDGWCLSEQNSIKYTKFTEQPTNELIISHLCKFGYQPAITYIRKQKINTILWII